MYESPRPEDVGDQRIPIDAQADDLGAAPDPRSEPGLAGALARFPVWILAGGALLIALIVIYIAALLGPG